MPILFIFIVIVVIIVFLRNVDSIDNSKKYNRNTINNKNNSTINYNKPPKTYKLPNANDLLRNVNSISDFKILEKKFKNAEARLNESYSEYSVLKYDIYNVAYYSALDLCLHFQYIPDLDRLSTTADLLYAFKVVQLSEYNEIKNDNFKSTNSNNWYGVTINDFLNNNFEEKPNYFKSLVKYRNIVDNKGIDWLEKAKLVKRLMKTDPEFHEEILNEYEHYSFIKEWVTDMEHYNIDTMKYDFDEKS